MGSNSGVCSLHFHEDDFVRGTTDSNSWRKKQVESRVCDQKRLASSAVPSVFPNLPSYLSKERVAPRTSTATTEQRHVKEQQKLDEQIEEFFEQDRVSDFEHFSSNLHNITLPTEVQCISAQEYVAFLRLQWKDGIPSISSSLQIDRSLKIQASVKGVLVSKQLHHLISDDMIITSYSTVTNILAHLKYLENQEDAISLTIVESCVGLLEMACHTCSVEKDKNRLMFLKEQLSLASTGVNARRYSSDLLAAAVLWKTSSPSLYKQLREEELLTLPSVGHLQFLTKSLNVEPGLTSSSLTYFLNRRKFIFPLLQKPGKIIA